MWIMVGLPCGQVCGCSVSSRLLKSALPSSSGDLRRAASVIRSISRDKSRTEIPGLVLRLPASHSSNDYSYPLPLLPHIATVTDISACEQMLYRRYCGRASTQYWRGSRARVEGMGVCGWATQIQTFVPRYTSLMLSDRVQRQVDRLLDQDSELTGRQSRHE